MMKNAFDLTLADWEGWCCEKGLPKYCAKQIFQWVFQKGKRDPLEFSNLSLTIRQSLKDSFSWVLLEIDSHLISRDESEKVLLKTFDDLLIEMVVMPYDNRVTLCLSSQVGCKRGCTFCQTGRMGLKRNLTSGEILGQLLLANELLKTKDRIVTNVVFMGMGEPLDNYDEVIKACTIMLDENGFGLSSKRVTISTSGVVPMIVRLGKELPVRLAISLHSADDEKRSKMMPINRIYNLEVLKKALIDYPAPHRLGITFEYVMIEGVNDTKEDARQLIEFLHGMKARVNLIPINHFPGVEMHPSSAKRLQDFQAQLTQCSIPAPVRYSRGVDISGGCGQLAAKRENELHLDPRVLHRERRRSVLNVL